MFVDYYCNICNSLRMVHLPFAAINGPLSLPAQRTKKVLEREELQRAQAIAVVSQVVFSYSQIMFWFSISECSTWIGNIQMESKHETTRQWMHRFVEVFWPSVVECPNFQSIRGQNWVTWSGLTNQRSGWRPIDQWHQGWEWQECDKQTVMMTLVFIDPLSPDTALHTPAHTSHCVTIIVWCQGPDQITHTLETQQGFYQDL